MAFATKKCRRKEGIRWLWRLTVLFERRNLTSDDRGLRKPSALQRAAAVAASWREEGWLLKTDWGPNLCVL